MNRSISKIHYVSALCLALSISCLTCRAQKMTDDEILSAIKEHPYRAAGCHSPYYAPNVTYTAAPKGYEVFYISHLGRHGSRYQTSGSSVYDKTVALLDSLHYAKALTSSGDSLRMELTHIRQAHKGMDGMLTRRGSEEHIGIASRLAARCPSLFRQKERNIVNCTSTARQRTIQSMAGFIAGLGLSPADIDFQIGCGFDFLDFKRPEDIVDNAKISAAIAEEEKLMAPSGLDALQSRLFNGFKASDDALYKLFVASASSGCLDIDVDPLRFFTPEELMAFYRKRDVSYNAKYGTFAPVRSETAKIGKAWLRRIVDDADKAIDGNGHCADLRFSHDSYLGPTMNLLGIGGYAISAYEDAPYRYWQSFNHICMASNLQLEFYKNAASDILVKALFNEREIEIPGLKAVNKVYYRWEDVRRYFIGKCEDVREVPEYYVSYLKEKAKEIKQLQKNEMDGFYFITDMHFPTNYGNSPALIEALAKMTEKRLIVFGGDVITYINEIDEAMAMQISALEQMRGISPILWARGNHDIVNYTGKKEWITVDRKAFPAWESSKLLGHFRPASAVTNDADPYTAYFYYDNPGKNVRYIVFDTTDSVRDDQKQDGLSDTQLKWIVEQAILGAPQGYGIVFVSHVPLLGEDERAQAKNALEAFSAHSTFSLDGKTYDFASRPDLNMICMICGHKHRDYSFNFAGGQPQINVVADCNYDYLFKLKGTVEEQSFDYVSIAKDGTVRTVRIGKGAEGRTFVSDKK